MEQLCNNKHELQKFYLLSRIAKTNRKRLGEAWKECLDIAAALNCQICRCPTCGFVITKNGGCDHMTCLCGRDFFFSEACCVMEDSVNYYIPSGPVKLQAPTKKLGPRLVLDDGYYTEDDCSSYDEYSCSDIQEKESFCLSIESAPNNVLTPSIDTNYGDIGSHTSSEIPSSIATWYGIREEDWDQDFEVLDMDSSQRDNSAVGEKESAECSSAWEEISE
eukprot:scaffold5021_cov78-Cylindrotheca_fusiformis.AAC.2